MQYQAVGGEVEVSPATGAQQFTPSLLSLASGNILSLLAASNGVTYATVLDPAGHALGNAFQIGPDAGAVFSNPGVASLPDGSIEATWVTVTETSQSGVQVTESGLVIQRYDANGVLSGPQMTVYNTGAGLGGAWIAALAGGGEVVASEVSSYNPSGSNNSSVFVEALDANGDILGSRSFPISGGDVAVTKLADGGAAIAWTYASGLDVQRIDSHGMLQGATVIANSASDIGGPYNIELAQLPNGNLLAVWQDGGGLHAQLLDANGDKVGGEISPENQYPIGYQAFSSAVLASGDFVLTWAPDAPNADGFNADGSAIMAQVYGDDGNALAPAFQVNTTITYGVNDPQAVALPSGGFSITWLDGEHFPDTSGENIKARYYEPIAHAAHANDFNGDGHSDILWRNDNGNLTEWQVTGDIGQVTPNAYGNAGVGPDWHVAETFDFNGDGLSDILWRNAGTGQFTVWEGAAGGFTQNAYSDTSVGRDWQIAAVGDLDGDGKDDIVWHNDTTGTVTTWQSTGTGFSENVAVYQDIPLAYRIVGLGDFDGDGKADLLWRDQTTGQFTTWDSNGQAFDTNVYTDSTVGTDWHVQAIADFDGDGKSDILWRNAASGEFTIWTSTGTGFTPNTYIDTSVGSDWRIAQTVDFNGDGKADILWRNSTTGTFTIWQSNGHGFDENVAVQTGVGTDWHVQGHEYLYG